MSSIVSYIPANKVYSYVEKIIEIFGISKIWVGFFFSFPPCFLDYFCFYHTIFLLVYCGYYLLDFMDQML